MSSSNIKFGSISRRSDEVVCTLVFSYIHESIDLMSRTFRIFLFEALAHSVELALFRESCEAPRTTKASKFSSTSTQTWPVRELFSHSPQPYYCKETTCECMTTNALVYYLFRTLIIAMDRPSEPTENHDFVRSPREIRLLTCEEPRHVRILVLRHCGKGQAGFVRPSQL
jgi:hypothetical protein